MPWWKESERPVSARYPHPHGTAESASPVEPFPFQNRSIQTDCRTRVVARFRYAMGDSHVIAKGTSDFIALQ